MSALWSKEGSVDVDLRRIAEDYVRVWDVSSADGLADDLFDREVVDHNPQPGQGPGLAGVQQVIGLYHTVFPDLTLTCDDIVPSGDKVAVRWTAIGTHKGDQLGVPATRRKVTLTGIDIVRIADGRIVERWGEANGLEMMQQIAPQ
jgi:predicted ester cyclase